MPNPVEMVEVWRGEFLESRHMGHAVICDASGAIEDAWGDPDAVILPRSSVKMIQALPLLTSSAADAARLSPQQLALACASHQGAALHSNQVKAWLQDLGMTDDDLLCGPQMPRDALAKKEVLCSDKSPCRYHNNCSGKHCGFLTLARHLGAGPDYVDPAHPVQRAVRDAFEQVTGEASPGFGIDGCSAPNFATTMHGLARAMAFFASAHTRSDAMSAAAARLVSSMIAHPDLVAGEGRACTELMRATGGAAAIKTGAEAVFVGILPQQQLGIAVKIADGATRASECVIAALLARLGVLAPDQPAALRRMNAPIANWDGLQTGVIRPSAALA